MTPESFLAWIKHMKLLGFASNKQKCAQALGVSEKTLYNWIEKGTDKRTALACKALINGLEPYA